MEYQVLYLFYDILINCFVLLLFAGLKYKVKLYNNKNKEGALKAGNVQYYY